MLQSLQGRLENDIDESIEFKLCIVLCLQWKHTSVLKESHRCHKKKSIKNVLFSYFEQE